MANTYTLIASNTLSSSAASVTFSSIPGTYTDLVVRYSARDATDPGSGAYAKLRFNSDTATNYSETYLYGISGLSPQSARGTNQTLTYLSYMNDTGDTANTFNNAEIYIPSYTASQNKPFSVYPVTENNSTAADAASVNIAAQLWRNTAAITSITLTAGGNFAVGSSFFLYGIKNS